MATVSLYTKFTPHRSAAIREGLRMVRNVIASDASKDGLTTSELYNLALKERPRKDFIEVLKQAKEGETTKVVQVAGREEVPAPPNPKHPLKSLTFLKRAVLPLLQNTQEIRIVKSTRIPVAPAEETLPNANAKNLGKKGKKAQKEAEPAATPAPVHPVTVYLWKQFPPSQRKPPTSTQGYPGWQKTKLADLGLNVDPTSLAQVGHLNRRRKFARYEKLFREQAKIQREGRRIANGTEEESFTIPELKMMARNDRDDARRLRLF
ncbi:hypothetical protein V5O48_014247 [Marasmius crinis-equi]|uniref:Uncharacterized protein n=1 Tax=Marasmius crinis-equi TaxID=585013 RepID=A0ABR3EXV1_9AGAR